MDYLYPTIVDMAGPRGEFTHLTFDGDKLVVDETSGGSLLTLTPLENGAWAPWRTIAILCTTDMTPRGV